MKKVEIQIKVLPHGENLPLPSYKTPLASGMDIVAAVQDNVVLEPLSVKAIETGIKMAIPKGYEVQIRPRSGLALKNSITCLNTPGTIDADYRGEIKIILANLGKDSFVVERGMRIAQAVVCPVVQGELTVVDKLDNTIRGEGGFGSTGVK
jgi:deoxyuridine 5'-triphosphate nucleotidohydrolase